MTRDEEIRMQSKRYSEEVSNGKHYRDLECGFVSGAEWADEHPKNPWRDTRKDPPQLKQQVILKSWSERNTYYESLSTGDLQYIKENPELWPYWMPIPETPKGGDE